MATTSPKTTRTSVEIFGSVYTVLGEHDDEYLQELAGLVDSTMRQIADHVTTVDTAKIAILAALNLADDLIRSQRESTEDRTPEDLRRVARLTKRLTQALEA